MREYLVEALFDKMCLSVAAQVTAQVFFQVSRRQCANEMVLTLCSRQKQIGPLNEVDA